MSLKLHDCNLAGFKQTFTVRRKRHNKELRRRKKNSLMRFNFSPVSCPGRTHKQSKPPCSMHQEEFSYLPGPTYTPAELL